jgi:hypothetical protein
MDAVLRELFTVPELRKCLVIYDCMSPVGTGSKGQVVDLILWTISETDVGVFNENVVKLQLGGSV